MIQTRRSYPEPPALSAIRAKRLPELRGLSTVRGDDIDDYQVARDDLYASQFFKCCYCEQMLERRHRPVEHFRPKVAYWWLSWTWENLLFCCESCNEHKGDRFPLARGSRLVAEQVPPGRERPLLIDPASAAPDEDPVRHIQFRPVSGRWLPFPRNGSRRGAAIIQTCHLDRGDLVSLYNQHVARLLGQVRSFRRTLREGGPARIAEDWLDLTVRWLSPRSPFAALSHDVLDQELPAAVRRRHHLLLTAPHPDAEVSLPNAPA